MSLTFLGNHKCPNCLKRFFKYKSLKRKEESDKEKGVYKIYWQNACPYCENIMNEGELTTSSSSSMNQLIENFSKEVDRQ